MAAPTEIYVDPAIAGNSGTGTIGDPYGDLQYALNTATRDATNGNRINIKTGTSEILAATISLATYGNPTEDAPLIFQGYTSAAGDGGQGVIDGNNGGFTLVPDKNYLYFVDIRLTNSGAAKILTPIAHMRFMRCEIDTGGAASFMVDCGIFSGVCFENCYIHGGTSSLIGISGGHVINCYFSGAFLRAIDMVGNGNNVAIRNIISVTGASIGIYSRERSQIIRNNSIFGASGTGSGIELTADSDGVIIENNIVEGFSGSGGCGIKVASGAHVGIYGYNAYYNNTTNESGLSSDGYYVNEGDNETLGATPFAKSGSDTFANRATYFAPVDTGNIQGGATPTTLRLDKGAVQHADPAGASMLVHPGMNGGLRG